ncbi:hypothetical protein HX071_18695, partial [Myroides marinus]|uniref:MBG domain-containing protein n=1 Tax=Myroides marinus TaxID=703342 RepID=UPI002576719A
GTYVIYAYYENGQEIGTTAPYDAGDYIVKAIVDRGSNYEPLTLETELKINQVVPAVDPNEMEVVYTGEAITIELAKELSYEANIEYVNNVHTDAGTYQGKAIITGGRNYKDIEVELTLVIAKAPIEGLTLPGLPLVYDGQPKPLIVSGDVPEGVDLIYTYTDKDGNPIQGAPTDAGIYNVTVTV